MTIPGGAGYSGKPLCAKLGIGISSRVFVKDAPADYHRLLKPIPEGVRFLRRLDAKVDLAHLFCSTRRSLAVLLAEARGRLRDDAVIWVSWPKRASGVATDITEDVIRQVALPMGLVDVKVCAVDETWSGLKLVVRMENRGPGPGSPRPARGR